MSRTKQALLGIKLAWILFRAKRGLKKADRTMEKARRAKARAKEREEAAKAIESNLNGELNRQDKRKEMT